MDKKKLIYLLLILLLLSLALNAWLLYGPGAADATPANGIIGGW